MFINDFKDYSQEEILEEYRATKEQADFVDKIIFADYTYECWTGDSHVVFIGKDGKMYEVHGCHCSCYGLEDQWEPEEATLEYFAAQHEKGLVCPELAKVLNLV